MMNEDNGILYVPMDPLVERAKMIADLIKQKDGLIEEDVAQLDELISIIMDTLRPGKASAALRSITGGLDETHH